MYHDLRFDIERPYSIAAPRTPWSWRRRIVTALAGVILLWVSLLGFAGLRYMNDRRYCRTGYMGADGTAVWTGVNRACIARREAMRWGPYHDFGSNRGPD
jgi:hypothetical protein